VTLRTFYFFALLLALVWAGAVSAQAPGGGQTGAAPHLRVCLTDAPHAPWRIADSDGQVRGRGLDFELVKAMQGRSRYLIDVQVLSGRRCLVELQLGRFDATIGPSHTQERAEFLRYPMRKGELDVSQALRWDSYSLYRHPSAQIGWDGRDLRLPAGVSVAVQSGHAIAPLLQAAGHPVDENLRRADLILQQLVAGTIQVAALQTSEAEWLRQRHVGWQIVQRLEPPLKVKPYFVVFSERFAREHEAELPRLWQAFSLAVEQTPGYPRGKRPAQ
jgi:polar amino acid transport system substrate-binding protein